MHTYKYLSLLLLVFLAVATGFQPEVRSDLATVRPLQARDVGLSPRAIDLGGLIGNLLGSIGPLLDLINPDTFKDIATVLRNAASLLDDNMVKLIKNLIYNADDLLTPELVKLISGLIDALGPIIDTLAQLIGSVISLLFGGSSSSGVSTAPDTTTSTSSATSSNETSPPFSLNLGGSSDSQDSSVTTSDSAPTATGDITIPTGDTSLPSSGDLGSSGTATDSAGGPIFTGAASSVRTSMGLSSALFVLGAIILS